MLCTGNSAAALDRQHLKSGYSNRSKDLEAALGALAPARDKQRVEGLKQTIGGKTKKKFEKRINHTASKNKKIGKNMNEAKPGCHVPGPRPPPEKRATPRPPAALG